MQLIMCQFCLSCVKFLQIVCFLNTGLEHSRSNLVFEICNLFSECSFEIIVSAREIVTRESLARRQEVDCNSLKVQ